MTSPNHLVVNKSNPLIGKIQIPGDKSISHRSIILGSLSEGRLEISNFLTSTDCIATVNAMRQLGADITMHDSQVLINGKGLHGLKEPTGTIDAGNSGTLIRLLSGILAAQDFTSSITGDESLVKRPMARVINPLISCGASIESDDYKAPLKIIGSKSLSAISYKQDIASAQVKSCLMMSALYIEEESTFYEQTPTRDHTENLLEHLDYKIFRNDNSFSFKGRLSVLKQMGAQIETCNIQKISNEYVGDIKVKYSKLKPINISGEIIPSLIDELPILFIACSVASGVSKISGIEELRYKESDRIKAMEDGLNAIGIKVSSTQDSIEITGGKIKGGKIDTYDDHRIAMSFAVAGLISETSLTIMNTRNIDTSFPNFVTTLKDLGGEVYEI